MRVHEPRSAHESAQDDTTSWTDPTRAFPQHPRGTPALAWTIAPVALAANSRASSSGSSAILHVVNGSLARNGGSLMSSVAAGCLAR